jgi:UrcA family protein
VIIMNLWKCRFPVTKSHGAGCGGWASFHFSSLAQNVGFGGESRFNAKESAMYRFTSMVIIAALALTCVAYAGPAPDRPHVVVHFADLDLSRSQGAAVLYRRLRAAAETVCAPLDDRDLGRHLRFKACAQSALCRAVAELDRPALTEYYRARTSGYHHDSR